MNKKEQYEDIIKVLPSLLDGVNDNIANIANTVSLIFHNLSNVSWCGVYFNKNNELVLGPFQGKIACTRISFNHGVCGKCARTLKTIVVPNVHEFEGHIACDASSNSEIVVPMIKNNKLIGVLDLDSYEFNTFDQIDELYLTKIAEILLNNFN